MKYKRVAGAHLRKSAVFGDDKSRNDRGRGLLQRAAGCTRRAGARKKDGGGGCSRPPRLFTHPKSSSGQKGFAPMKSTFSLAFPPARTAIPFKNAAWVGRDEWQKYHAKLIFPPHRVQRPTKRPCSRRHDQFAACARRPAQSAVVHRALCVP